MLIAYIVTCIHALIIAPGSDGVLTKSHTFSAKKFDLRVDAAYYQIATTKRYGRLHKPTYGILLPMAQCSVVLKYQEEATEE